MCQHCQTDDTSVPCRSCKICSPPPPPKETKCYLSLYQCDDSKSIKSCHMVLLFGESNEKNSITTKASDSFDWKYVDLPCPHCQFSHNFKRVTWFEEHLVPVPPSYFEE